MRSNRAAGKQSPCEFFYRSVAPYGGPVRDEVALGLADSVPCVWVGQDGANVADLLVSDSDSTEGPNKKLRFLVFATEWFSGKGGLSTFNRELCEGLVRLGCEVTCCVEALTPEEEEDAAAKGVTVHRPDECRSLGREAFLLAPRVPPLQPPRPFDFVIGHGRVTGHYARTFVRHYSPDSRWIHFIHVAPQCIEWHKGDADAAQTAESRKQEEAELVTFADFAFGVGPLLRDEFQTVVRNATVYEFRPGLFDISRAEGAPAVAQCLVLGRAEDLELKGLDTAAMALAALNRDGVDCRLVVRGAPQNAGAALRATLKKLDEPSPLDIQVFEYTNDRRRVLADVFESSLMLMPSRSEGFGLVALEAISASVPVLLSARSGLAKLLANLLPNDSDAEPAVVAITEHLKTDASAWKTRIASIVGNRPAAFQRAARLREKLAQHLSWDESIQDFLDVLSRGRAKPSPTTPATTAGPSEVETALVAISASEQTATVISEAPSGIVAPNSVETLQAATLDLRAARVSAAQDRLRKFLEGDVPPAERRAALVLQASAHLAVGQEAEATECLRSAQAAEPTTAEGLASGSVAALLGEDDATAFQLAEAAVAADPRCERALTAFVESAPAQVTVEELVQRVSGEGELASGPAAALANRAHRRGLLDEAVEFAREADKTSPWPSLQRKLQLGSMLLEATTSSGGRPDPKMALEAVAVLREAVGILEGGDSRERLGSALSLLAMAHALAGDEGAADIASARATELAPSDDNVVFRSAAMLVERGNAREALAQLRRLSTPRPETRMLEAEALYALDRHEEALQIAQLIEPGTLPAQLVHQWVRVQLAILSRRQQWTQARAQIERGLAVQPRSVFLLAAAARLERQAGGEAQGALARAMSEIENAPAHELEFLLDELVRRHAWDQAGEVMKRLHQVPGNATPLETEVWVAYNLGDLELALTLCRRRREEGLMHPDLVGIEASILEEIGALADAADLLDEALESWSSDAHLWLRRSAVALRRRDRETCERCLAHLPSHFADVHLNAQYVFQLSAAGRLREAVNAAYEHRRVRFNDAEAHGAYVQTFLRLPSDFMAEPLEAGADCAVQLRTEGEGDGWWIFETAPQPQIARHELDGASPLRRALEGRKSGEKVHVPVLGEVELCEVVSKFVYAFRESLSLFGSVLDDATIQPVRVDGPKGLEPLLDAIRSRGERTAEVLDLYDSGRLTVGACAAALSVPQFEMLASMLNDPARTIRCNDGAPQSMAAAMRLLASGPRLVCDPTSILLLSVLDLGPAVRHRFGKLLVSQSLLDAAQQGLFGASEAGRRAQMSLHYADGQYYRRENTPDEAEQKRAFWGALISFISENCEVVPCWGALKIPRKLRTEQSQVLDGPSVDALLLATEPGRVLMSDDGMLRSLGGAEFGAAGVWTQAVMLSLQDGGQLAPRAYAEATIGLVRAGLAFVTINGEVLLVAAERDGWGPGDEFRRVMKLLGAANVEFSSAVAAATDFITRLWDSAATDVSRNSLLTVLLNALSVGRQRRMVSKGIERGLRVRLQFAPSVVHEAVAILRVWEATKLA